MPETKSGVASDTDTHEIREFTADMLDLNHCYTIVYGCSNSGKTYLCRWLLNEIKTKFPGAYDKYMLVAPTESLSHTWSCFPKENIIDDYSEEWLQALLDERLEKIRRRRKVDKLFLVLDDVVSNPKIRHSRALDMLFISGRHAKIQVWLLSQNVNPGSSISPAMRNNTQYVITSAPRKRKDAKFLIDEYFSLRDPKEGEEVLRSITEGGERYTFAVVDLKEFATARHITDYVFRLRAGGSPKFMLGGAAAERKNRNDMKFIERQFI